MDKVTLDEKREFFIMDEMFSKWPEMIKLIEKLKKQQEFDTIMKEREIKFKKLKAVRKLIPLSPEALEQERIKREIEKQRIFEILKKQQQQQKKKKMDITKEWLRAFMYLKN